LTKVQTPTRQGCVPLSYFTINCWKIKRIWT